MSPASCTWMREQFLDIANMVLIGCADEMVVGDVARVPGGAEGGAHPIGERFRRHASIRCGLGDLVAVLIVPVR